MFGSSKSRKRKSSRSSRSRKSRGAGRASVRLAWLLGAATVLVILGVGLLNWTRTDTGQAALLRWGAEDRHAPVQEAMDRTLAAILPGWTPGPAAAAADPLRHDWLLPGQSAAAIRCRCAPLPPGKSFWEAGLAVAEAAAAAGGGVLWGERLERPRSRWSKRPAGDTGDLLRLDVGVPGHPTHTLLLYAEEAGPPTVRWGDAGEIDSASDLLGEADRATVAIVVDDWGNTVTETTRELLRLDVPLTMSVLPGRPFSRRYSLCGTELALPVDDDDSGPVAIDPPARIRRERRDRGCLVDLSLGRGRRVEPPARRREIILHLPMEPQDYPDTDPGRLAIMKGMSRNEIEVVVEQALGSMPGVTGVNNHMGSAATADKKTMKDLMEVLRGRGLFFLDSKTTSRSVAAAAARSEGIPTLENRIFLDQKVTTADVVRRNLDLLVRAARSSAYAVGICHPYPETLAVLKAELPKYAEQGIRFVTLSELMALRSEREARLAAR